MTIAAAGIRVIASIILVAGFCSTAQAATSDTQPTYTLIPVQISMTPKLPPTGLAAGKRNNTPVKRQVGEAQQEDKRLVEALNRLSPKERKRLAKAMKHLNPEQRQQLIETLKRQLVPTGSAPHIVRRAR